MAKKLTKQLTLLHVYAIATGAMISSGLFVLPGIAASKSGPAAILAYALSGFLLLPSLFAKAELATAMPRAGGTYFFISRSLGGMFGTIDGIGVWLALILKTSIALVGLGAYLSPYLGLSMTSIAITSCFIFIVMNYFGTKEAAGIQVGMVIIMLLILVLLVFSGVPQIKHEQLTPFLPNGWKPLLPTTAFLFISYIGLTKVASMAEEVKDPERNIPLGMIISLASVMIIYGLVVWVVIGVIPPEKLYKTLTPVSDAARLTIGNTGAHLISIAAALAFATTANAGILSASRYLLAMSRDKAIPEKLSTLSRYDTPIYAIVLTGTVIILIVSATGLEQIAKLASTFQLIEFGMVNLSIIIMRESGIKSYDPGFKTPLYPAMPIAGIMISAVLIPEMGLMANIFAMGLIGLGITWYNLYTRHHVQRVGAVAQVAQQVAERLLAKDANAMGLKEELREIIKEKGLRKGDPYGRVVHDANVHFVSDYESSEDILRHSSQRLAKLSGVSGDLILGALLERNRLGETPADVGVALPHVLLDEVEDFHMIIARSRKGVEFPNAKMPIHAVFVLLGSRADPAQHLRILAEIARRADNPKFLERWNSAESPEALKLLLLEEPAPRVKKKRKTEDGKESK